jgi:hypothetical protein
MAWITGYTVTGVGIGASTSPDWVLSTSPNRMNINTSPVRSTLSTTGYTLTYTSTPYSWKANKTYQFKTTMRSFYATASNFSMTPWGINSLGGKNPIDKLNFNQASGTTPSTTPGANNQYFYHYSSPNSDFNSSTYMLYRANAGLIGNTGILGLTATEIDFTIQGFSYYKLAGYELTNPKFLGTSQSHVSLGWLYDRDQDVYFWYDSSNNGKNPVGGVNGLKTAKSGYRRNNYIAKFIQYNSFNITFNYQNISNHPVNIYLSTSLPSNNSEVFSPPVGSILLGTLTHSMNYDLTTQTYGTYSSYDYAIPQAFYGLKGNKYIYFVGPYVGTTSATYSGFYISNIKVEGGYHSGNNRKYLLTNSSVYSNPTTLSAIGLTGATYSANVGQGNTVNATQYLSVSSIFSKIGNGTFKSGIWENGVWNSGWRVDDGMYEFYDVYQHFSYNMLKKWRVQIQGPTSSVAKFAVGDNISIGNIVAIDINDNRRLLKNYFTIINKTVDSIIVEFDNNFPLRRIERDSENHRMYITKNVWLSGGFLNGYFKGIWNYGLFKGYPLITEMYDSHWIDGIFDGGHFNTVKYPSATFSDTLYYKDSDNIGYVGLTFSFKHNLVSKDVITIDKSNKLINPQYDGEHTVKYIINDYHVVIDQEWGSDTSNEGGTSSVNKSKGVIQKMSFKSNNKSRITSIQSEQSASVFTFNSWIDVNYDDSSAVNIGKPQNLLSRFRTSYYSENNLYGYPTLDVLESDSIFRDSFSTTIRKYRLGTKYKIFADFIGDSGKFENYFDNLNESGFTSQGWTFSRGSISSLTFSRTEDKGVYPLTGEELKVQAIGDGGILNITPYSLMDISLRNRAMYDLGRNRYTKVDFDLVTHSMAGVPYYGLSNENIVTAFPGLSIVSSNGSLDSGTLDDVMPNTWSDQGGGYGLFGFTTVPSIHFDNINKIVRNIYYDLDGVTASTVIDATFLPIYQNVNHLNTKKTKKTEYFFNKRNLGMRFYGNISQTVDYTIDNLHFYEVDMIPFFQYFTEDTINKGVEIPFQGISPFIDYSNANFNFIDNISIGLDSIKTQNSNTPVSGVGVGVGVGIVSVNSTGIYAAEYFSGISGKVGVGFAALPYTISGNTSTTSATITGTITVSSSPVTINLTSSANSSFIFFGTQYTTATLVIGGTGTITGGSRTMTHNSNTSSISVNTTRTLTANVVYPYTLSITTTNTGLASFSLS